MSYPSSLSGSARLRKWQGDDGKYETSYGATRKKWNYYGLETAEQHMSFAAYQFRCILPGGGTDTTFVVDGNAYRPNSNSQYPSDSEMDLNRAISKVVAGVKGHSFNLAVSLAESGELARTVEFNLGQFGRAVLALKHGDFATAARTLGVRKRSTRLKVSDISGRWLELQYGWLPSLSDAYNAAKAFEAISKGPRTARFHGSTAVVRQKYNYSPTYGYATRDHTRQMIYSFELFEEMDFNRQLGLLDPLSVAWELIPYSFVVDWFVPIGTYLSNLNQIPSMKGRWSVSNVLRASGPIDYEWTGPYPYCGYHHSTHRYQVLVKKPSCTGEWAWYSRNPGQSLHVPSPSFKLGGAVHGTRVWNAIALAFQRFRG